MAPLPTTRPLSLIATAKLFRWKPAGPKRSIGPLAAASASRVTPIPSDGAHDSVGSRRTAMNALDRWMIRRSRITAPPAVMGAGNDHRICSRTDKAAVAWIARLRAWAGGGYSAARAARYTSGRDA